ncbi:MAG TPA: prephenate dehydrogenase/arogenate dehydrogenase family protein [Burkholderiaceae bacterium]
MKVAILGCGLMGGSLAAALRGGSLASSIIGYDLDPAIAERGVALDLLDAAADSPAQAAGAADLVVLAAPVSAIPALLAGIADALAPAAIVTDLASTKADVVSAARRALGPAFARFVPAHPIAGGERSGLDGAEPDLFQGRTVVITPESETRAEAVDRVEQLWLSCGAKVVRMDAVRHDCLLASVSHLPHLLAFAVVAQIADQPDAQDKLSIAGPGFRDFTRIAASSPTLWRDIALANREAVSQQLRGLIALLQQAEQALVAGDGQRLHQMFELASRTRRRMNGDSDGR